MPSFASSSQQVTIVIDTREQEPYGFDAARSQYVDLMAAGIIDPTKVVRVALENAVSVASVLLLTEATMTELPEPKELHASPLEPGME